MKFKLEYVMEVDDLELLEIVNDYLRRSDEPTFNTLDDIPEALMIEALDEANYIEDEINDYMMTLKFLNYEEVSNSCFYILVWNG